jgi:hypothetical protein
MIASGLINAISARVQDGEKYSIKMLREEMHKRRHIFIDMHEYDMLAYLKDCGVIQNSVWVHKLSPPKDRKDTQPIKIKTKTKVGSVQDAIKSCR